MPRHPSIPRVAAVMRAAAITLALTATVAASAATISRDRERAPRFSGRSLTVALRELENRGLPLIFTSSVVTASMRVTHEPQSSDPRQILDEVLEPHHLRVVEAPGGYLIIVAASRASIRGRVIESGGGPVGGVKIRLPGNGVETRSDAQGRFQIHDLAPGTYLLEARQAGFVIGTYPIRITKGEDASVLVELDPAPLDLGEIIVVASPQHAEALGTYGAQRIDVGESAVLPRFGDDPLRAAALAPGTAGLEASSRFHVRGGRDDEVLVTLDGLELIEPYHLQDHESALSIVAPISLERAELFTGGYPAEYGDRMGGVLNLKTIEPSAARQFEVSLGLGYGQLSGGGHFGGDQGHWFGAARSGSHRFSLEIEGRHENPRYWDLFGKVDSPLGMRHLVRLGVLMATDEFEFDDAAGDRESYRNHWDNRYAWLTHEATTRESLFVDTVASVGHLDRHRIGSADGSQQRFRMNDRRESAVGGLKQSWLLQFRSEYSVRWGFDARRFGTSIDYDNERELSGPLTPIRAEPSVGSTSFQRQFDTHQLGGWISVDVRPVPELIFDLGVRYDEFSLTREHHVSPRLNLSWEASDRSALRAAWGQYHQSQRPYELQAEDGQTTLERSERTEDRVLGFEHRLESGAAIRVEAYQRRLFHPRARFENLFHPVRVLPELAQDRVRIAPDSGRAEGIELTVYTPRRPRFNGWVSYVLSSSFDDVEGIRVPRPFDERHAVRANLNVRLDRGWNLNAVWIYHSGWPITALSGELAPAEDGSSTVTPVLGPLNGRHLPDYHRLDLRLSREWTPRRGKRLAAWIDLQNLYDRSNVRGFDDFVVDVDDSGAPAFTAETVTWGGFVPSFGIRWRF